MKGECSQNCASLANHECAAAVFKKRRESRTKTAFYIHFVRGNLHNQFIHGSCIHGKAPVRIERFRSRDQHLCKFIGTEEGFNIRKRFDSTQDRSGTPRWSTFYCFMVANVYARSAHCVCDKFRNLEIYKPRFVRNRGCKYPENYQEGMNEPFFFRTRRTS